MVTNDPTLNQYELLRIDLAREKSMREMSERALTDERAKVARIAALCDQADMLFDEPRIWTQEIRDALEGP